LRSPSKNIAKNQISKSEEAYNILKETVEKKNLRDESSIYGEHIAAKHRKYSSQTKSTVEHLIAGILFKADMGEYEKTISYQAPISYSTYPLRSSSNYAMYNSAELNAPSTTSSSAQYYNSFET